MRCLHVGYVVVRVVVSADVLDWLWLGFVLFCFFDRENIDVLINSTIVTSKLVME